MQTAQTSIQNLIAQFYAKKYNTFVRSLGFTSGKGSSLIEDLTQDAIIKSLDYSNKIESIEQLEQFLRVTVKNAIIDDSRKKQSVSCNFIDSETEQTEALAGICYIDEYAQDIKIYEAQRMQRLHSLANAKNAKDNGKEAFAALWQQGDKVIEIAQKLNMPVGSVKSMLNRLIKAGVLQARNKRKA